MLFTMPTDFVKHDIKLKRERDALPIVQKLRADPEKWTEKDPYTWLDAHPDRLRRNLSAGSLSGEGKVISLH